MMSSVDYDDSVHILSSAHMNALMFFSSVQLKNLSHKHTIRC